jgi:hypothetical protein
MFEDYAVIPLDLPLPPVQWEKLRDFVHQHCESALFLDNIARFILFNARKPVVDGELLLHPPDPRFDDTDERTEFGWDPVFAALFPDFIRWFDVFPFNPLQGVTLVTQTADVPEHIDIAGRHNSVSFYETWRRLEPRYYRAIIADWTEEGDVTGSFFITEEYGGERRYVRLPPETRAFALGSSTCYHGATLNEGRFKSTIAVYGRLDDAAHYALLQRSLDRFPDHVIRLNEPGPVAGPGARHLYR